jgi:Putative polyhydroxyalkanoic acid system protein (PHA_gran_rgn)
MSRPLVVTIPHSLGKEEAIRRLKGGLLQLKERTGDKLVAVDTHWDDNKASFSLSMFGQSASGNLEVMDDSVRLEVQLPWFLQMIAEKAKALIQKQGHLMLEKK